MVPWAWPVGAEGMCSVPLPPGAPLRAQALRVTSAGGPAGPRSLWCPWEEPGPCGGPRRAGSAGGHRAIAIRARERVAAAPGILLKAFSLFPAICSAPPGPGHVDNLFVEGKGGEEHRREEEMSLFTQPAFCSMGPSAGQPEWGVHRPSPVQKVGVSARLCGSTAGVAAARGGGGRVGGPLEVWSPRDPRPRPAADPRPRLCCGLGGKGAAEASCALTLA